MPCRIELQPVELELRIGCTAEERSRPQPLCVQVRIRSDELFPASQTDRLEDTLDAAAVKEVLLRELPGPIQTLERLGSLLQRRIEERFTHPGLAWELSIHKPRFEWTYVHAWRS